jgi:TetR/AcrR family transcriptional regulator, ethionamide resistance regulator
VSNFAVVASAPYGGGVIPSSKSSSQVRPTKGDLREANILSSARSLFAERGYDAVTVSDIATSAGVTRTAFYFYYHAKPDVLLALMQQYWDESAATHTWFDTTGPAPEVLREQLSRSAKVWRQHAGVLACTPAAMASSPELRDFHERVEERHARLVTKKIECDQEAGYAIKTIPAARLAEMMTAMRDRRFAQVGEADDAELQQSVDYLTTAILRLIYA